MKLPEHEQFIARQRTTDVVKDVFVNGFSPNHAVAAAEHYRKDLTGKMDDQELDEFVEDVVFSGAVSAVDHQGEPLDAALHVARVTRVVQPTVQRALKLSYEAEEMGRFAENAPATRGLAEASCAMLAKLIRNEENELTINDRMALFVDRYDRSIGLIEPHSTKPSNKWLISDFLTIGEELLAQPPIMHDEHDHVIADPTHTSLFDVDLNEDSVRQTLRDAAITLPGGIDNSRTQHLLRITTPNVGEDDYTGSLIQYDFGNNLILAGMYREGLALLNEITELRMVSHIHDPEVMQGDPWSSITSLLRDDASRRYGIEALDYIQANYPRTFKHIEDIYLFISPDVLTALVMGGRTEELTTVIDSIAMPSSVHNLKHSVRKIVTKIAARDVFTPQFSDDILDQAVAHVAQLDVDTFDEQGAEVFMRNWYKNVTQKFIEQKQHAEQSDESAD